MKLKKKKKTCRMKDIKSMKGIIMVHALAWQHRFTAESLFVITTTKKKKKHLSMDNNIHYDNPMYVCRWIMDEC